MRTIDLKEYLNSTTDAEKVFDQVDCDFLRDCPGTSWAGSLYATLDLGALYIPYCPDQG